MRREYPEQPIVGVGALIVDEENLLLVKRGVNPAKGKWSVPGGAVELGERMRDAVIREVKEECGLDVEIVLDKPLDAIDNITMSKDGRFKYHYVLLQFLVRLKGGVLPPASDVLDAKWVPFDKVKTYDLTKSFRVFFGKHQNKLKNV
jgi:ADP-ribose pyrophosphatase YjhB (NUDIX family)